MNGNVNSYFGGTDKTFPSMPGLDGAGEEILVFTLNFTFYSLLLLL